jgi:nitrate/TMAO reductase-like tetraheme cytochrome c subunit
MSSLVPLYSLITIALLLCLAIALRPRVELTLRGRVFAFVAIVLAPLAAGFAGLDAHMERSKTVAFCLSCHPMEKYGRSLFIDDVTHLPAAHYQYNRVPRETACFSCHTTYTMFGDYRAKLQGLHHVYVQYLGKVPKPEDIKLYQPFNNRECLHCHAGARSFLEAVPHKNADGGLSGILNNRLSCLTKGCHEEVHDLAHLDSLPLWSQPK